MTGTWLLLGLVVLLLAAERVLRGRGVLADRGPPQRHRAAGGDQLRARSTIKAMEEVSLMMACAQLGITLCGVLLGAVGEPAVATLLEPVFEAVGVPECLAAPGVPDHRAAAGGVRACRAG